MLVVQKKVRFKQMCIYGPVKHLRYSTSAKTVNYPVGVFRTESNIYDGDFGETLFQPFTIYTKSSILDVRLRSEYDSGAVSYFCKKLDFTCPTPFGISLWNS